MTLPTVFANLAAGVQPASLLDTMFNLVAAQGIIPCTAAGTNAITISPQTNYYAPLAYANFQSVNFRAAATSTGAVTIQLGGLAFVKLFMANGVQANSGDIVNGTHYVAFFASDLDSGNGGFIINNSTVAAATPPVAGSVSNLVITVTSNTQATVTCDEIVVENASGGTTRLSTVSLTGNITGSGANGLDTGAVAANKPYSVWVVYNGTTTSALFSLSATAPSMPAGYTYKARVGWVITQQASTSLIVTIQKGRRAQYVTTVTSTGATVNLPLLVRCTGTGAGTTSASIFTSQPVSVTGGRDAGVPSTATEAILVGMNGFNGNANQQLQITTNSGAGQASATTNPVPFAIQGTNTEVRAMSFLLEGPNIFFACTSGATNGAAIFVLGWVDAVNAS